jgi:Asp-tRNA(Asn)/Glu-tRNA(Gln) amidotransferase A subunit family amidase
LSEFLRDLEARFDQIEPQVGAFLPEPGRFERLGREAGELSERHPQTRARPELYAAPVGVKDIFHLQGFETRAGSRLPSELFHGPDGPAVTRLRASGALVVGKTVTTEFAYFAPGPTRNPRDLRRTPGGSSSGSAAAVAAGLCSLALGTQTIGSIIRPAAYCGIVGFKPTRDRIPRDGVIPLSPSLDHVGYFAPDVESALLAAPALLDAWKGVPERGRPRLGVPEGPYLSFAHGAALRRLRSAVRSLEEDGYEVRAVSVMQDFERIKTQHETLVAVEAAGVHAQWFSEHRDLYHPKTAELILRGQRVSSDDARSARVGRDGLREALAAPMRREGIDLWISPSATGTAPLGLERTGDPVMNLPWTYAGLPTATVPSGTDADGLPYGLQLSGAWGEDEALLSWAGAIAAVLGAVRDWPALERAVA